MVTRNDFQATESAEPREIICKYCLNAKAIFACQCCDPNLPLCLNCFGDHFKADPETPHWTAPLNQEMFTPREEGDLVKRNRAKMYLVTHLTEQVKHAEQIVESRIQELEQRRDATVAAIQSKTGALLSGLSDQLSQIKEYQQQLKNEIQNENPVKDEHTDGQRLLDSIPMDDYRTFICEAITISTDFNDVCYNELID